MLVWLWMVILIVYVKKFCKITNRLLPFLELASVQVYLTKKKHYSYSIITRSNFKCSSVKNFDNQESTFYPKYLCNILCFGWHCKPLFVNSCFPTANKIWKIS
uniref:Secreted protein n=1 Tax=Heterorhabditis bacteriophora TaxID=37862 RepID=A0A1I7WGE0_HETBA